MKPPIAGVWTPWAEVLCRVCHDALPDEVTAPGRRTAKRKVKWPANDEKSASDGPGLCSRCGEPVWVQEDVAQLSRLRKLTDGELEQTGGMCAALTIARPDGGTVVVTNLDGPIWIGLYKPGEWEEGGETAQAYCIPESTTDEVAAVVIQRALLETLEGK